MVIFSFLFLRPSKTWGGPWPSGSYGPGGKCTLFIGRWRRLDLSPFRLSGLSDFSKEVWQWVKIDSEINNFLGCQIQRLLSFWVGLYKMYDCCNCCSYSCSSVHRVAVLCNFLRSIQIWKKSSSWFGRLLSKCTNHEEDCTNFCVLLRKSGLY